MIDSRVILNAAPISLTLFLLYQYWRRPKIRHPPSPSSFPLVGNLFSIPPDHEHLAFSKLGEQLGSDIVFLEVLGQKIIVLNSAEAALELLEKRSALYSDRPPIPMVTDPELMNWGGHISLLGYNDTWRQYRRMINDWLNVRAVTQFNNTQEERAQSLLRRLLDVTNHKQPFERVKDEIFFSMGSSMLQLAYGYKPQDPGDRFLKESRLAFHNVISAGAQTNYLVNLFPALLYTPNWFPGSGWKRIGKEYGIQKDRAMTEPYSWMKAQIADGTHQPSLLSGLLQNHQIMSGMNSMERDARMKEIGITLFGGGTDTSSNFLISLLNVMVLNPHVQAKAQQELDVVLGHAVLPRISDRGRLPYIGNLIYEVLRLYPVLPLGNVWAICRDPHYYPDPEVCNPDRYLNPDVPRPPVFGWGRRKCPGNHFGEIAAFITTASLPATFQFLKKRDSNGQGIIPSTELERKGLVLELKPFEFEFKPRSEQHRHLILGTSIDDE